MSDAQKAARGAASRRRNRVERSLLDQIVEEGRLARDPAAKERGKNLVKEFVAQVLEGAMTISKDAEAMINARIAQIDHLVSIQLNEVLHHPAFQKLEGELARSEVPDGSERNQRQAEDQASSTSPSGNCCATCSGRRNSTRARCSRRSTKKNTAYSAAPRSRRWSAITNSAAGPEDIELLEKVSQVAAAAHAPFLTAASPEMLNLESFTHIDAPRDMAKIFDTSEYAKWKSFRQSEDSRYVGLCLPHVLMRLPYGKDGAQIDAFNYEEGVDGTRPLQVPVGQRGLRPGRAADAGFRPLRLVRGHPRRGGRRPGGRPADPQLHHRLRRRGAEVPHRNRRLPTAAKRSWRTWASSRWCTARAPTTRRSSACSRRRSPSCTIRIPPTPTPAFPRSCRTSWRSRASRIT